MLIYRGVIYSRQTCQAQQASRTTDLSRANLFCVPFWNQQKHCLKWITPRSGGPGCEGGATSVFQASFKQADFTEADLREVNFGRSDFLGANFTKADLRKANLAYSRLSGALFSDARVENLMLHQASGLDNQTLDWLRNKSAQLLIRKAWKKALQSGAQNSCYVVVV